MIFVVIVLLIGASVVSSTGMVEKSIKSPINRSVLYVGGSGPGNYSMIQDAIDNASDGDTVYVFNGTYNESWLFPECSYIYIDKSINLIGENKNTTIVNCPDSGMSGGQIGIRIGFSGIISVSDVFIFGLTLKGGYDSESIGIYLQRDSENTTIEDCIVHNFADGMQFVNGSRNITIKNCITYNNSRCGGISFAWHNVSNFEISGCSSYSNAYGIHITAGGTNGLIYHNNLYDNVINAYGESNNTWDNGYPSGGNYWSDYTVDDLYSGPNQDIPGPDGIGDTPYNISGGDNQDLYPLMHPFELYYILNISASSEVNEGELFNVVVTSMGGTAIPNATVEFNDELKLTDSDGRVCFTAPLVETDTYYDITATKTGYTGDIKTILVKDIPVEFVSTFMFGRIINLNTTGEYITFNAVNVRAITLSPFSFIPYTSGELITILKDYTGLLGALFGVQFIFATCDASIG